MPGTFGWEDVYAAMADLRAMADRLLANESDARSLQPTALVLTALRRQKLEGRDWSEVSWETRRHFFGAMQLAMKRALIDHARIRNANKRLAIKAKSIGEFQIEDLPKLADEQPEVYIALGLAIEELNNTHPEWARVFEDRYYNGLTIEQIAGLMEVSEKTIRNWSNRARILLRDAIERILTEGSEKES